MIREILRMPEDTGSAGGASGAGFGAGTTDPISQAANYLNSFAGIFGSIFSGLSQQRLNNWLKGAAIMAHQHAVAGNAAATDAYYRIQSLVQNPNAEITNGMLRQILDQAPFLQKSFEDQVGKVDQLYKNADERFNSTNQQEAQQALRLLGAQGGNLGATAQSVFEGGGWTPQYQDLFDRLAPYMSGRGSNSQIALDDVGSNLIGQRGQTALTNSLTDAAMRASDSGGMDADLRGARNIALGTLGAQGKTPGLENLSAQALRLLSSGGANAYTDAGSDAGLGIIRQGGENDTTRFMQGRGADLAGREALLPMDQAVGMATEDAQNRLVRQAEKLREQARLRGGEFVRSGASNEGLWDVSSEIGERVAEARRQAMLTQQGLQQQENQIGAGLLSSGGGLANSRLGTGANTLSSLQDIAARRLGVGASLAPAGEQIAAGREATALGGITGVTDAATQALAAYLRSGIDAGGLENARMGTGAGMANSYNQSVQQALAQFLAGQGQQNQYALGAGGLANASQGTQAGIYNNIFGNDLARQGLGVQAAGSQAQAGQNALAGQNNLYNSFNNAYSNASGQLSNSAADMLRYASSWIPGMNPFGQLGGLQNPWAALSSQRGNNG